MSDYMPDYKHQLGDTCPCGQGKLVLKRVSGGIVLVCDKQDRHFRFATDTEQDKYASAGRYISNRWPKGYIVTA
jgi:hypothetical protein